MPQLIKSKQIRVHFVFCPHPIMMDLSEVFGPGNLQFAQSGAFLKMQDDHFTVSHLVQSNADQTAPIGWRPTSQKGRFDKNPIWVEEEKLVAGDVVNMMTKDGKINYEVTEPSRICYNDLNGQPDLTDRWVQKESVLRQNYEM